MRMTYRVNCAGVSCRTGYTSHHPSQRQTFNHAHSHSHLCIKIQTFSPFSRLFYFPKMASAVSPNPTSEMEVQAEQKGEKLVEGAIVEDGQLLDASEEEMRYFQGTEGLVKVFVSQG